ncbi:hypothetical protein C2G38_2153017 [Gigaspora rosea]|uniref:Uncharacterized protein n=1 Tax=Gigaspora rosea TaxID=44941 RepID=A0A397W6D5_9GLOM|nr:hypothetical protein C2G38_2153017 [Gigaspora rosea]
MSKGSESSEKKMNEHKNQARLRIKEFYKKGIFKNVKKFLEWIEKGADTLTEENVDDDDEDDIENVEENFREVETIDISASLAAQIEQIKYW